MLCNRVREKPNRRASLGGISLSSSSTTSSPSSAATAVATVRTGTKTETGNEVNGILPTHPSTGSFHTTGEPSLSPSPSTGSIRRIPPYQPPPPHLTAAMVKGCFDLLISHRHRTHGGEW